MSFFLTVRDMLKERPEKLEKLGVYGLSLGKRALCKQHEVVSRKEGLVKESKELDEQHNPGGSSTGWCVYLLLELQRKSRRDDFTTSGVHQALMQGPFDACHATSPAFAKPIFASPTWLLEFCCVASSYRIALITKHLRPSFSNETSQSASIRLFLTWPRHPCS